METTLTCQRCKYPIAQDFYFCPSCAKKLREKPLGIVDELGLYLISIFVPPIGLLRGYTLLKQQSNSFKRQGIIAIVLTLLSLFLAIRWTLDLTNSITSIPYGPTGNLQNLGF